MKKLMIAAAIVCVAALSQAASMQWGTGKIYKPNADGTMSETLAKTTVTAYYFKLNSTQYTGLLAATYAETAANVFAEYATVDGKKFTVSGQTSSSKLANNNGSNKNFTDPYTYYTDGADTTGYAAMILKYSDTTSGQDYYIANLATYTFEADADKGLATMGMYQFGIEDETTRVAIDSWTKATSAVPEPTSGLLLLLGVAGLALKRRRA